jgi:hypothetical protein
MKKKQNVVFINDIEHILPNKIICAICNKHINKNEIAIIYKNDKIGFVCNSLDCIIKWHNNKKTIGQ